MTGPEHYAEAERLLAAADNPNVSIEWITFCHEAAQVHATLANAAARVNAFHSLDPAKAAGVDWSEVLT